MRKFWTNLAVSGINIRQYKVSAAGRAPIISISLHATSATTGASPSAFEPPPKFLNATQTAIVTAELTRIPDPCMENTAAIKAPRVLLLENSDMMVAESG